ncbi:hypothetical protein BJP25_06915 [Actinokineospora bangkokensis]|uniref:Uncharacterized protein n=2 Tax=Actinokineospora bangkokensis TaxID=1193682 RepID=A0A1Q9LU13_9PSEU|nr:hypothetical protein BJP25_06915 [Actinokineospora bangkokensis]
MTPRRWRRAGVVACLLALVATALTAVAPAGAATAPSGFAPVVFVHGQQGSAQQWQSNAKRFSVNGYADDLLHAYEYDSSITTDDQAIAGLDEFIAGVRARTGAPQVDLIAHSRGTGIAQAYLGTPARAATVRRYVNVDGRTSATPPGGVPTLALWSSLQPNGSIGGATNVHLPNSAHTESTTSAEGFGHIFRFLRDRPATTTAVLPELPGQVVIAGRAALYPQNRGLVGQLRVWLLDDRTGARVGAPAHSVTTGADGSFGPLRVDGRAHYEAELVRPGELVHHFYFEPFERSDRFVRLPVASPGGVADQVDRCPGHSAFTVIRNREWWGDQLAPGADDRLRFDGVDVVTAATAPRLRQVIGAFVFDDGCDGVSAPGLVLPPFALLPFVTGTDLRVPAQPDAGRTVRVTETVRGSGGATRTIAARNWPSDQHSITVQFKDYVDIG